MKSLSICLISPRFEPSFWGREYALPLMPGDKRAWMLAGGLPLLAALTPDIHDITLIDEAVEDIDFDALGRFDVIGVTGMIVQRDRMREILARLRGLDAQIVVGGAYASIDETFFDGLCDAIFVGEAETTWPAYIDTLARGEVPAYRHAQDKPTDMTTVPPGRLDLVKDRHYATASMQYSRGCPFTCEFCDIIVVFGRRPRVKTPEQVIAELDDIRAAGFTSCFVVDDNFIGNKVAVKKMLRDLITWQERHGYPLALSTEATLNLADDPELMDLMYRANFRDVFIGIESPRAASLVETKKLQNIRGDSMAAKLARIRDAGIVVSAGFIVGFDEDDTAIFDEQVKFIEDNTIAQAALGMLTALPTTPLYDRLQAEGRLVPDDPVCNFEPRQMTRAALTAGCADTLQRLYTADAFFGRLRRNVSASPALTERRAALVRKTRRTGHAWRRQLAGTAASATMMWRLARAMRAQGQLRSGLVMYVRQYSATPRGMWSFGTFLWFCLLHWHHHRLTQIAPGTDRRSMNYFSAAPVPPAKTPAE